MGDAGASLSQAMEVPCHCTLFALTPLVQKGTLAREILYRCTLRKQGPQARTLPTKKMTSSIFNGFCSFFWPQPCTLLPLRTIKNSMFLLVHPLDIFPQTCTLSTNFSSVHCFYAVPMRPSPLSAQGYVDKGGWSFLGFLGCILASWGFLGWHPASCGLLG